MIMIFIFLPRVFARVIHAIVRLLWPRDRPPAILPFFTISGHFSTRLCCRLAATNEFLLRFQPLPFRFPPFPSHLLPFHLQYLIFNHPGEPIRPLPHPWPIPEPIFLFPSSIFPFPPIRYQEEHFSPFISKSVQ